MSNQGMRKECNFCGAKFGQGVKLCPNCGSASIKLVAQESAVFLEAVSEENEKTTLVDSTKKKPKKNRKKIIVILVSVLVGVLALLIVISQLLIRWADKTVEKEKLSLNEQVERVLDDTEMSDEEWKEAMIPLLDELYSFHMNEEIAEVFDKALTENRPIYDWEHYLYASCLVDFYVVEGIWEYEQSVGSLKDYHNTQLLYYYLEYMGVEDREELTAEEKDRLQRYVMKLQQDVITRFSLKEEELEEIYGKACEEFGYVDYFVVEGLLREREGIKQQEKEEVQPIENIEEAIKATERLYGVEWQKAMRPILNQLYEQNDYKAIYDIYVDVKVEDTNKPISHWEHYLYARALYDIYDIEKVLEIEASGEQIKEWQYINILVDYFVFEDFENRTNLTEEEKERLMPLVIKLREDATSRWNLSEEEWEELRNSVVSEYNVVQYEEAEKFVESWMEKKGYTNDGNTFEEEAFHSIDLDDATWEKRFFPKLDKIYEQGKDKELYDAQLSAYRYGRMLNRWQHADYCDMLGEYYYAENIWIEEAMKGDEIELRDYQYTQLLYSYLVFEHLETSRSLSEDEMEKLKPYREKILQDGSSRWNFSEEEWEQINYTIDTKGGIVYYFDVSDFIKQWLENN